MPFPLPSGKTRSATLLINKGAPVVQAMCVLGDRECQIVGYDGLFSITTQSLIKKLVEMTENVQLIDIHDELFIQVTGADASQITRQIPHEIYNEVEEWKYLPAAYALY